MKPTYPLILDEIALRRKYPFAKLVRPMTGLLSGVSRMKQEIGDPCFHVATSTFGNLTMAFPHVSKGQGDDVRTEPLGGAGADADPELAWVRAAAEGAERYACMVYDEADFIVGSARELGDRAMSLTRIPPCSEAEYADPACPLRRPDEDAPIRWVRGYSLIDGRERLAPAVMTYLYLAAWDAEQFWTQISTGIAAHTSLAAALVSAICEVIERDAIALTWLARLPLARIVLPEPSPLALSENLRRLSASYVTQHFFDATTDLLVPTVFSVQLTENHPYARIHVSCATTFDPAVAAAKTIREAAPSRMAFSFPRNVPEDVADFCTLTDGASLYGRGGREGDFGFLLEGAATTTLQAMAARLGGATLDSDEARLQWLVARLRSLGMEAIAVDITTDEIRDAGLWVVRVVIPDLLPMCTVQRARHLGAARLYAHAARAGRTISEADVNPNPMPFA